MKVAYVINSLEGGGASKPVPAVTGLMRAEGCDVRVLALTPRDRRGEPAIREAGVPMTVRDGGETDHLAALRWLDGCAREWGADLLWTSLTRATLLGQIVGQLRGIDVVSWQHAAYLKPANAALLKLRRRQSLLWVADSDSVAALTATRLGVAADRIATWPLFAADPDARQAAGWQAGQPIRIGSLGRLHPVKGYDVLIAALARMRAGGFAPPAPLVVEIAGDGAEEARLRAQGEAAGLPFLRFAGFSEPGAFLSALHLYVQPSRSEGLCIAAHEAMQAGLSVLASAVGELPHTVVGGVTGGLVPPGDVEALAAALAVLLRDPDRLATMGRASRARVLERFGPERFAMAGAEALGRVRSLRASARGGAGGRSASRVPNGRSA